MQEAFGIRDESTFKAASGLHGGMGKGDVCGSLMGSVLMIGLMCGKGIDESAESEERSHSVAGPPEPDLLTRLVGELYDWFNCEFGSVKCNNIRSSHEEKVDASPDIRGLSPEERDQRIHARCDQLCGKTAARAVEIIWNNVRK